MDSSPITQEAAPAATPSASPAELEPLTTASAVGQIRFYQSCQASNLDPVDAQPKTVFMSARRIVWRATRRVLLAQALTITSAQDADRISWKFSSSLVFSASLLVLRLISSTTPPQNNANNVLQLVRLA